LKQSKESLEEIVIAKSDEKIFKSTKEIVTKGNQGNQFAEETSCVISGFFGLFLNASLFIMMSFSIRNWLLVGLVLSAAFKVDGTFRTKVFNKIFRTSASIAAAVCLGNPQISLADAGAGVVSS
jgi:intracellular septation protein A